MRSDVVSRFAYFNAILQSIITSLEAPSHLTKSILGEDQRHAPSECCRQVATERKGDGVVHEQSGASLTRAGNVLSDEDWD